MTYPEPATGAPMRLIATEEAFAPQEYLDEYIKMAASSDAPVARYLRMYYQKSEFARQLTDMAPRLADMDLHGVDMHVLSITGPGRFAGLAAVAPQAPEQAALEIERAIGTLGLNGIIINSHTHGQFLDDPACWPILEAAQAHDAAIYLHPSFPPESMLAPYSQYGMMGALWGFQAECSLHAVRMILAGVFDRFPRLRIVLGHLGEGIPYWLSRLDNRYQNILRRGGLAPLGMTRLERLPSEYFMSNFHVTTAGMNAQAPFDYCLNLLGPERVLFAIDYPYEQTAEATAFVRQLALPSAQLAQVCHANAARVFNIKTPSGATTGDSQ